MLKAFLIAGRVVLAATVLFAAAQSYAAEIGRFQFVIGEVTVTDAGGRTRPAVKGNGINEGDTVGTAALGSAQLQMVDGAFVAVRADSKVKFDQYRYNGKEDGTERGFLSLVAGGFRTVTGVIGRSNKANYSINTPTATIGIRGTDHETVYVPAPGENGTIKPAGVDWPVPSIMLGQVSAEEMRDAVRLAQAYATQTDVDMPFLLAAAPPGGGPTSSFTPGTFNKVNTGQTIMNGTLINQGQAGFAANKNLPANIVPIPTGLFKATSTPGQKPQAQSTQQSQQQQAAGGGGGTTGGAAGGGGTAGGGAAGGGNTAGGGGTGGGTGGGEQQAIRTSAPTDSAPAVTAGGTGGTTSGGTTGISTGTTSGTGGTGGTSTTTTTVVQQVVLTDTTSGNKLNATQQTLTTSGGTTVSISQGAFGTQAQASATAAQNSVNALNALVTSAGASANTVTASNAVSSAQSALTSLQSSAAPVLALTINTATATSTAASAASLAATALNQANAANTAFTANGAFADSSAVTAKNTLTTANNLVQTTNTGIQSALTTATSSSSALLAQQQAITAALNTASAAVSSAGTVLTALTAQGLNNTTLSGALSIAQAAASAAQTAATLAASLQASGDSTGATAQAAIAAQQATIAATALSSASQILASAGATGAVASAAATISTAVTAAQTAQTAGAAAATSIASSVSTVSTNAAVVNTNAPIAGYNNPAVASTNFGATVLHLKPVTGGVEHPNVKQSSLTGVVPNTTFVLDGSKNLVEIRNADYTRFGFNYTPQSPITNADIKFTGGVAKDQFNDANGAVYIGRWQGGQVDVYASSAASTPLFSDLLGLTSAHWIVGLGPANSAFTNVAGPINNVQLVTGTANYSLLASTHPTDAFGNVGTLNSASLSANFNAQTVNASLGVTFSKTDAVNISSRNLNFSATASNVPIMGTSFDATGSFSPTITCTSSSGDCAASYVGGLGGRFGANAGGGTSTGAVGTGVGLGYSFNPTIASPIANQPYTDFIQGVAVLTTGTAPTPGFFPTSLGTGQYRDQFIFTASTASNGYTINQYVDSTLSPANPTTGVTIGAPTGNAGTFLVRANRGPTDTANDPNTNLLLDSSGNLARVNSTPYRVQDRGNNVTAVQSGYGTLPSTAMVSISGATVEANTVSPAGFPTGVTVGGSYNDTANNIRLGRYQGGTVAVEDLTSFTTSFVNLGNTSAYWAVREIVPSIPVTGNFTYTPVYATRPSDSLGNLGVLNYASLTAHFNGGTPTIDPAVSVTVNNQTLTATGSNIGISPITFGFSQGSGQTNQPLDVIRVSCFGSNCATAVPTSPNGSVGCVNPGFCGSPYSVNISGGFGGANGQAGGASFSYEFNTTYNSADPQAGSRPTNDYITGSVAFTKGTAVQAQSLATGISGQNTVVTAYSTSTCSSPPCTTGNRYSLPGANPLGGAPSVTITDDSPSDQSPKSLTLSAGTPASAMSGTATGITIGRYTGATVSADNNFNGGSGVTFPATVLGSFDWASVPANAFPASILTGSAVYTFDKGFAFNQSGIAGTFVNPSGVATNPSLAVNFNSQSVNVNNLNISVPAGSGSNAVTWLVTANGIRLQDVPATFQARANCSGCVQQNMTVALKDGANSAAGINIFGTLQGTLGSIGLSGAGLTFAFSGQDTANSNHPEQISGAAAFALTSFTTTPNGVTTVTSGTVGAPAVINGNNPEYAVYISVAGLNPGAGTAGLNGSGNSNDLLTGVQPGIVGSLTGTTPRTVLDTNGNPIQIDGQSNVVTSCGTGCSNNSNVNATFSVLQSALTSAGFSTATAATIVDSGRDSQTGISWGRYAAGSVLVTSRGGGFSPFTLDVSTQSMPFIFSGQQNGAVVLPISGSATYGFVGGTRPTDNFGNVGTLTAQALNVNFTAQTTSASITAVFNATNGLTGGANPLPANNTGTWVASTGTGAAGSPTSFIPIQQGIYFQGQTGAPASNLTASSTASVPGGGTTVTGNLTGIFTGNSGQGAMVGYSLNKGGVIGTSTLGTTISGVAAFRRP